MDFLKQDSMNIVALLFFRELCQSDYCSYSLSNPIDEERASRFVRQEFDRKGCLSGALRPSDNHNPLLFA
jgi:hypothetical protein